MGFKRLDADVKACKEDLDTGFLSEARHQTMAADWLIIRIIGTVEVNIEDAVSYRCHRHKDKRIDAFVGAATDRLFRNPDWQAIVGIASMFGEDLENVLKASIPDEEKQALNSVVLSRHAIAHGGVANLTLRDVLQLYPSVRKLTIAVVDQIVGC